MSSVVRCISLLAVVSRTRRFVAVLVAAGAVGTSLSAAAADEFTDALQRAYVPYRVALFKTNSGSLPDAKAALDAGASAWAVVATRYASGAPAPYASDKRLPDSMAAVDKSWREAIGLVAAGNAAGAHVALEAIQATLADLRARNQVIVYSDHMNAYHAEMEEALTIKPSSDGAFADAIRRHAVLSYLARRLHDAAPASMNEDTAFRELLGGVDGSLKSLGEAIASKDAGGLGEALGKLKQPYSKLFLRFG